MDALTARHNALPSPSPSPSPSPPGSLGVEPPVARPPHTNTPATIECSLPREQSSGHFPAHSSHEDPHEQGTDQSRAVGEGAVALTRHKVEENDPGIQIPTYGTE
ncbi:hypothetical protein BU26DRAFT_183215 [Trematosphaeria pertusa]|uniref:Uncharacterized protein n=1 Tax=Trematosphaeria pertusa TaxID=390896 RepID=A0A6A6HSR6_9PLEO|nr:uncharacterized protein BU26DRAFT_183215 [Trematosphaeria pertusa]KAF2241215.1 hypothetical protein BU26DRAFT_183215 [Trematosphaeria pertusa]